ncbi:unnamed protein product [Anisakis simplex]|uniref:YTH domain-containing protein n=1 Tax=Anisakis simplex TaxID=6269 RepID=A0A0M3K278_ANISI|nr:unnamed protein product [Anisakis simplex]
MMSNSPYGQQFYNSLPNIASTPLYGASQAPYANAWNNSAPLPSPISPFLPSDPSISWNSFNGAVPVDINNNLLNVSNGNAPNFNASRNSILPNQGQPQSSMSPGSLASFNATNGSYPGQSSSYYPNLYSQQGMNASGASAANGGHQLMEYDGRAGVMMQTPGQGRSVYLGGGGRSSDYAMGQDGVVATFETLPTGEARIIIGEGPPETLRVTRLEFFFICSPSSELMNMMLPNRSVGIWKHLVIIDRNLNGSKCK